MKSQHVLVGMSGGLDSSVAANLLKKKGYEVTGLTLLTQTGDLQEGDAKQAEKVCRHLGIAHHTVDVSERFRREIIDYYVNSYLEGSTPNPCIRCNVLIKFHSLLAYADEIGCDYVATGHYARLEFREYWRLLRGNDSRKDQSYFLFMLDQKQMSRILFPLGEMSKPEAAKFAVNDGLPITERGESQEACFVPEADVDRFIRTEGAGLVKPGEIVDEEGRTIGAHSGIHRFTVGQRRGIGIAASEPLYVLRLEPDQGRVVVGPCASLEKFSGAINDLHWCSGKAPDAQPIELLVQIRYRHHAVKAQLSFQGNKGALLFEEPVVGWTPGQAAVFYRGQEVIGGGWIAQDG